MMILQFLSESGSGVRTSISPKQIALAGPSGHFTVRMSVDCIRLKTKGQPGSVRVKLTLC